jgi:uncharacterized membrane protein
MKKLLLLIFVLFIVINLNAQDTIINQKNENLLKYEDAKIMNEMGKGLLAAGIPLGIISIPFIILAFNDTYISDYNAKIVCVSLGCISAFTSAFLIPFGIVYTIAGKARMNHYGITVYDNYKTSLNMAIYGNGIGIKLKF